MADKEIKVVGETKDGNETAIQQKVKVKFTEAHPTATKWGKRIGLVLLGVGIGALCSGGKSKKNAGTSYSSADVYSAPSSSSDGGFTID